MRTYFYKFQSKGFLCAVIALCVGVFSLTSRELAAQEFVAVAGKTESRSIMNNMLDTEASSITIEVFEDGLPAADFSKYELVILAPTIEYAYSPEDCGVIEEFVLQGGRLLLIQQAPKKLRITEDNQDRVSDYLFGRSYYYKDRISCMVLEAEDRLLKGVLDANPEPEWLTADVLLNNPEFETLIGNDGRILVGRMKKGKGTVYYVGHELFRMQLVQRPERHADAGSWKTLLANIILDRNNPEETQ